MGITESITINELLSKYPYLQDYLIQRSPKFKKLTNPVIRSTMGKIATVAKAAAVAGIGFHGPTLLHRPQDGRTWQTGDGALLAPPTRLGGG